MGTDDDDGDDDAGFGAPLPPDDRLWRHPSELREHGALGGGPLPVLVAERPGPNPKAVALASALAGAVLTVGLLALAGLMSPGSGDRELVQKVALEPIVSVPPAQGGQGVTELAKRLEPALVRIDGPAATGSGVLFRDDGMVLTSAHLVREEGPIRVRLSDGRQLEGRLVGTDPLTDLAVVDLEGEDYPVAVLGTTKYLEVGATAIALGSTQSDHGEPTVATGVISALGSTSQGPDNMLHGLIQTDAPVWGNCTGGALVDATGAVIGITSAAAGGADRGVAYATPVDVARWVAGQIVAHGRPVRGWLGIDGTTLPVERADELGVRGGAVIRRVHDGSPAAAAGLDPDDVITSIDRREVVSIQSLVVELRDHEPGDTVEVTYWRDGDERQLRIELDERP